MSFRTSTWPSTAASCSSLERLREALDTVDAVILGAGAGLSASAGFVYDGERFERYFRDFGEKYGFHDMYTGGFYPYATAEEHWAYWSRYVWVNRYQDPPRPVYQELLQLVREKDYFVLTTNVDHCFQKAGFDQKRLFYTQGDYGLFQCSEPCCPETWENRSAIQDMMEFQENMRVPAELLPRCPRCGRPLTMNLRSDDKFVQDAGWYRAAGRYHDFLRRHRRGKVLCLELGVGYNTPGIIKYPFWKMTLQNREAVYACVNRGQAFVRGSSGGRPSASTGTSARSWSSSSRPRRRANDAPAGLRRMRRWGSRMSARCALQGNEKARRKRSVACDELVPVAI